MRLSHTVTVTRWVVEVNRPAKCNVCLQTGRNCYKTAQYWARGASLASGTSRWRQLWSSYLLSPPASSLGGWTTPTTSRSLSGRRKEERERAPGSSGARSTRETVSVDAQVRDGFMVYLNYLGKSLNSSRHSNTSPPPTLSEFFWPRSSCTGITKCNHGRNPKKSD